MGDRLFSYPCAGNHPVDTTLAPLNVPALLRQYGLQPKKSLGQNFLFDPYLLQSIVECAGVKSDLSVLEIGPGLGSLTRHLALAARQVVAVELDQNLIPVLCEVVRGYKNVKVLHGDILEQELVQIMGDEAFVVVANIPYYITSALLRHLLEAPIKPLRLTLTVQKEVAERICAPAGKSSLLSLSVQVYGHPQVMMHIPAGSFFPPPKVDSSVLRVDLFSQPLIQTDDIDLFFYLAKAGFQQKRKTLRNALSSGLHRPANEVDGILSGAEINPMRRAETLSLDEWRKLVAAYRELARKLR